MLRWRQTIALAIAVILHGCTEPDSSLKAPLPATAEGLVGSTWQLDEITLEFGAPPALTISGKALPFGKPAKGEFVVHDGIIEITAFGRARGGTWDGRSMVIDGIDARFVSKK